MNIRLATQTRLRLVLMLGIQMTLALLATRVFDRVLWPLLAIPIITMIAVVLSSRTKPWVHALASVGVVVGTTVLCSRWAGGPWLFWPNGDGIKQLLSTEWPSPITFRTVLAVGVSGSIVCLLSDWLTLRKDLHLTPLTPIAGAAVATVALSAADGPSWWLWAIGAVLAILFALVRPDMSVRKRSATLTGERSLFASLAAGSVAVMVAFLVSPTADRADPRQLDEPQTSAPLIDPIEATVAMHRSDPPVPIFRIENRSRLEGAATPTYWRTTALSVYDGQRWLPDSAIRPIGYRLSEMPDDSQLARAPFSFNIEVLSSVIDVLPFPGRPLFVEAPVNTDRDRVIVQLRERPEENGVIRASSLIQPNRSEIEGRAVETEPAGDFSASLTDLATQLVGDGTAMSQLEALEAEMRDQWLLDPSQPGAGQQFALIERFVRDTRRGTQEQFTSGFVLLARSLGYQARIATGFVVQSDGPSDLVTITTADAATWPEVNIEDLGWVRFDPTPPTIAEDAPQLEPEQQVQSPAAPQPPILPPAEETTRSTEPPNPDKSENSGLGQLGQAIMTIATYSAIIILPIALIIGGIVGLKARRRRRRLRHADPAARVRGAWANTTDFFVDAGLRIDPSDTNVNIADDAKPLAPTRPADVDRLAELSTGVTFGDPNTEAGIADHAIEMSSSVREAIGDNMTRWRRLRWRLSLRSLRRSTRSPVVP